MCFLVQFCSLFDEIFISGLLKVNRACITVKWRIRLQIEKEYYQHEYSECSELFQLQSSQLFQLQSSQLLQDSEFRIFTSELRLWYMFQHVVLCISLIRSCASKTYSWDYRLSGEDIFLSGSGSYKLRNYWISCSSTFIEDTGQARSQDFSWRGAYLNYRDHIF